MLALPRVHYRSTVSGLYCIPNMLTDTTLPEPIRKSGIFEPWQIQCNVVSDGKNPFLNLSKGSGWRINFLQLTPHFAEAEEVSYQVSDDGGEDDEDAGAYDTVILPPTWKLRAFVVREDDIDGLGIYGYHFLETPNERQWHQQLLLPYARD